jgi:2-polyprenyl-6-methoxyphenol hydroxylase-like FAD-dependent oxidoreductase
VSDPLEAEMPGATHHTYDVIVVGARCAGAATARLLAQRGHDVLLLDRATMPSDTLSTHGIARGGVVQLARWGLLDRLVEEGAPPIRQVTFAAPGSRTTKPVKDRAGVDVLLAPRRSRIDSLLLREARAAGATTLLGTGVTRVLWDAEGRAVGVEASRGLAPTQQFRARYVVAADGLRSSLAGQLGASTLHHFDTDAALFYAYVEGVDWDGFEFHVAAKVFAGAFPTHDDAACVWLSRPAPFQEPVRRAGARREEAWVELLRDTVPDLGMRVAAGRLTSPVRGCLAPPNFVRRAWGPGWALVGDAGYHRDPITGHGMTDAFRDAELLADALDAALTGSAEEADALDGYQSVRDTALAGTFRLTRELAAFPAPHHFVELQIALGEVLEREALWLASRPAPAGLHAAAA